MGTDLSDDDLLLSVLARPLMLDLEERDDRADDEHRGDHAVDDSVRQDAKECDADADGDDDMDEERDGCAKPYRGRFPFRREDQRREHRLVR